MGHFAAQSQNSPSAEIARSTLTPRAALENVEGRNVFSCKKPQTR